MPQPQASSELQLLLYCACISSEPERQSHLLRIIPEVRNWDLIISLAIQHSLIPLFYSRSKALIWEAIPFDTREQLTAIHQAQAKQALLLTGELIRLIRLLRQENIFALPHKGPSLAMQLYGDIAMRQYVDIDLVVDPSDVPAASTLMLKNEWRKDHRLNEAQEKVYLRNYKDYLFYSPQRNLLFELHWGFAARAYAFSLPLPDLQKRCREIRISNCRVPTLIPEDLLIVLCFHGSVHLWERIGWLTDIAELLTKYQNLNWAEVLDTAWRLKCRRILFFSLSLANQICRAPLPEFIACAIEREAKAVKLAKIIEAKILADPDWIPSLRERFFFYLRLRERWQEKFRYCWSTIFRVSEKDWLFFPFPLPSVLFFLYYPLRLARILKQYLF